MNSNIEGMRRQQPRSFVPSKRIKAEHRRNGQGASLKSFAGTTPRCSAGEWLSNKAGPPPSLSAPAPRGQPRWTHDGRSRLALGAPMTSPSGHVAAGCVFGV